MRAADERRSIAACAYGVGGRLVEVVVAEYDHWGRCGRRREAESPAQAKEFPANVISFASCASVHDFALVGPEEPAVLPGKRPTRTVGVKDG